MIGDSTSVGLTALFIGAHPDDIEIGAGGTVARLINMGWDVSYCIVTSEADPTMAEIRKQEAVKAANILGVMAQNVFFLYFPDGHFQTTAQAVGKFRKVLKERKLDPAIVFTHTAVDSHNDHRAVHSLVLATFRRKPILSFAVVNSLVTSEFKPTIFVEVSDYRAAKIEALRVYESQLGRINETAIDNVVKKFSVDTGLCYAEVFELLLQEGAEDMLYLALSLNDCPFHTFWYPLLREQPLILIHSVPVYRRKTCKWPADKERNGIELLYKTFSSLWYDRHPIESHSADTPRMDKELEVSNVLLSGSSASNQITHNYFNHFEGLRYVIDYTMPDYKNIYIRDRCSNKKIVAVYRENEFGERELVKDVGILTVMYSPMRETKTLIGCMGIHGFGTFGCFKVIADRNLLQELLSIVEFPSKPLGFQILIDVIVQKGKASLRKKSLHIISTSKQ